MANNRPAPSLDLGYAQNAPPIRLHSQTLAPHAWIFEAKNLCLISLLPLSHYLFTHPPPLNPWPSSVCPHWQVHLTHFSSSPLPVPKSRPLSPTRVQLQHILKPTFTPWITPLCRSLQWPPLSFRSCPPPPDDDIGTRHCGLADLPSPQVSPSRSLLSFAWTLDAQWLGVFGAFPHLFLCQVTMPHPLDSASPPVPSQPNLALVSHDVLGASCASFLCRCFLKYQSIRGKFCESEILASFTSGPTTCTQRWSIKMWGWLTAKGRLCVLASPSRLRSGVGEEQAEEWLVWQHCGF